MFGGTFKELRKSWPLDPGPERHSGTFQEGTAHFKTSELQTKMQTQLHQYKTASPNAILCNRSISNHGAKHRITPKAGLLLLLFSGPVLVLSDGYGFCSFGGPQGLYGIRSYQE
jgi:hypothetical protein